MTFLLDAIQFRKLIWTLAIHDFRSQYMDSILGFFWAWIKPLVMAGIYVVIFSSIAGPANPDGVSRVNFGLYVFAGMLPWFIVQESLQRGTTVLVDYAHLVRHHALPLFIFPFHIVLSATLSGVMAITVFMMIRWIFFEPLSYSCLLLVFILPLQIIFCSGISLLLATTTVFLRDVSHLTTAFLTIWFFASPIVFPLEALPWILRVPWLNPMVSLTMIYRDILLFDQLPSHINILWFTGFSLLVLMAGWFLYLKTSKEIVDWV